MLQGFTTIAAELKEHAATIIGLIVALSLLVYGMSCQPTVTSILNPDKRITVKQLDAEVVMLNAEVDKRYDDLRIQTALRDLIFQTAIQSASTSSFNLIPTLTALLSIFGVGALADNIRMRVKATNAGQTNTPA
jgi:hypothetical protein